jgi:hypothetical protein
MTAGLASLLATGGGGCGGSLTGGNDAAGGQGATGGNDAAGGQGATGGGRATGGAGGAGGASGVTDAGQPVDVFVPVCHPTDASVPSVAACEAAQAPDADTSTCPLGTTCYYTGCETIWCSCQAAPNGGPPSWTCEILI